MGPAGLEVVTAGTEAHRRWAYYLARHHDLGLRVVGQNTGRAWSGWRPLWNGRFAGTCYQAANWVRVGATHSRGRQDRQHRVAVPEKDVYLFPISS